VRSPVSRNLDGLASLSRTLEQGIQSARTEAQRASTQVDQLLYSKALVDESLRLLSTTQVPAVQTAAQTTIFPSGSLIFPTIEQFIALDAGGPRSNVSTQIYSTLQAGVSAFIETIEGVSPELRASVEPLRVKLQEHGAEIKSLEARLKERLRPYSPHLLTHLEGTMASFRDAGNPTRFANTGNLLRELHRELLADVAPDEDVKRAPWFVPKPPPGNPVTRRHRIEFAIFKNLKKTEFPESFADQADGVADRLIEDIDELSSYTHVTETVLESEMSDAAPVFASVMQGFLMLISAVESARILVEEDVGAQIWPYLDGRFTEDFFDELDQLSTHTRPQGACDIEITKFTFDERTIQFEGSGKVKCDLQWGSDGDVRRGDGAEGSATFPFTFAGRASIDDLSEIEIDRDSISIDTSSFYENDDD
jgi:hypothetical protein